MFSLPLCFIPISGGKRGDYQNCSVLYCVLRLCTVIISTLTWAVLTVLWIGFCLTGHTLLCLDSFVFMFVFFVLSCHTACVCRGPSCPEIPQISTLSWNLKLSWNLIHLIRMSWYWPLLCHSMWPFTVLVAAIVTVQCSMCNIALVTFLWLQYWSAWLICVHKKSAFSMCWASWDLKKCPEIY